MTKTEFDAMTIDEAIEWAQDNIDSITTETMLMEFVKSSIDHENLCLAIHILTAIYESVESYNGYYLYDYYMGTLEKPTPITDKEDLEDYIDFDYED